MSEYLAIDGWEEFQKYRGRRASFILDATDQNEKPKLSGLSHFVRSVLQELRRARGRTGKNIPYDLGHIARATHTIPTDRPHLHHAVLTLISRGILIVTNQQVDDLNPGEIEIENKREIKKEPKPSRTAKPPSDSRFPEFVDVLNRYHGKFVGEKLKFGLWFGSRGGRQLKNLLRAEPALDLHAFEQAVAVRARSPGIDHSQPVFEWLAHVLTKPRGANGQVGKAQQRHERNDDKYSRAVGVVSPRPGGNLPLGNDGGGARALLGKPELLPPARSQRGWPPADDSSA